MTTETKADATWTYKRHWIHPSDAWWVYDERGLFKAEFRNEDDAKLFVKAAIARAKGDA